MQTLSPEQQFEIARRVHETFKSTDAWRRGACGLVDANDPAVEHLDAAPPQPCRAVQYPQQRIPHPSPGRRTEPLPVGSVPSLFFQTEFSLQ